MDLNDATKWVDDMAKLDADDPVDDDAFRKLLALAKAGLELRKEMAKLQRSEAWDYAPEVLEAYDAALKSTEAK